MTTEEAANDIMRARERAAPLRWSVSRAYRAVALSIGYVALYLALDRLSLSGPCMASASRRGVQLQVSRWRC
jgi:hypothetical protein